MSECGYGPFDFGKCACIHVSPPGILDFFLNGVGYSDSPSGSADDRYFTRFAGSVSFSDDYVEGLDGSGRLKWGMQYRDNLRIVGQSCVASWNGDRVLRYEVASLPNFADTFASGSPVSIDSHTPSSDPHGVGWTATEGTWSVSGSAATLTSTGDGRATTDYRFPNATISAWFKTSTTNAEGGILARGDGTLGGSIRLHYSKSTKTATLYLYGVSTATLSMGSEAPVSVYMTIDAPGASVTASIRGYDSGGSPTGATKTTTTYTDAGFDQDDSPTIYGIYGEKGTGQDCVFDAPGGNVVQIVMHNINQVTLYTIGNTSANIEALGQYYGVPGALVTPNVITPGGLPNFSDGGTRTYRMIEEDSTVTTYTCVQDDDYTHPFFGATTNRAAGIDAGLWDPLGRDWGYGLGIKVSGTSWRLVGGPVVFPSSTSMPIIDEQDEIDSHDFSPASWPPLVNPGVTTVSYRSMADGSVVAGTWSHVSFATPSFSLRQFLKIGSAVHIVSEVIASSVIAPGLVACIVTAGSDREFRIYDASGIIYSDTHATRWDSATIPFASDRWFYAIGVTDWSGYVTSEPASIYGSPSTVGLLISMDGSQRVRMCQYNEEDSRYEDIYPGGSSGNLAYAFSRTGIDTVKICDEADHSLPESITFPA